jgi:DNA mismatch repair ATPase MutS
LFGVLNYSLAWYGLGATLLFNMFIHYRTKQKIYEHLSSIRYLGKLIRCSKSMIEIKHPMLESYRIEIEQALTKVSYITKKTGLLGREADYSYIYEYFNIIFLLEVRAFYSVLSALEKYEKQLKQIFATTGFIDSMIAIASFRAGLESYTEPKFLKSGFFLKIEEVVHPLLNEPVPNSISVEQGDVLVTGSNMSGKTTFLKAIGVNVVLAQTIYTCLAKEYQANFFHIMTLIGRKDNIIEGKSYYLDEIHALLRIINALEKDIPCLCLLDEILRGTNSLERISASAEDEIFRGTNSLERISASAEVLLYLAKNNCYVFAATHDLELTELIVSFYKNYHFKEEVSEEDGISFNYKLLDGPSTTRNAVTLLRHVGYPNEIADRADSRVQKSIKNQ